jgi:hypothetical protein
MFQVFYVDVAKVDLGCCVHMLQAYVSSVLNVSDICFKWFIWMLHMLLWLYTHVLRVCFKCFKRFKCMLRVFLHLDVEKVDMDVAYVAMVIHACFNRMFQVFYLFSYICCK